MWWALHACKYRHVHGIGQELVQATCKLDGFGLKNSQNQQVGAEDRLENPFLNGRVQQGVPEDRWAGIKRYLRIATERLNCIESIHRGRIEIEKTLRRRRRGNSCWSASTTTRRAGETAGRTAQHTPGRTASRTAGRTTGQRRAHGRVTGCSTASNRRRACSWLRGRWRFQFKTCDIGFHIRFEARLIRQNDRMGIVMVESKRASRTTRRREQVNHARHHIRAGVEIDAQNVDGVLTVAATADLHRLRLPQGGQLFGHHRIVKFENTERPRRFQIHANSHLLDLPGIHSPSLRHAVDVERARHIEKDGTQWA